MEGIKMYRTEDEVIICKNCHTVTSVGFNILQEEEYKAFTALCKSQSLCPKCLKLKKERIESLINDNKALIQTAKNMFAVGVL